MNSKEKVLAWVVRMRETHPGRTKVCALAILATIFLSPVLILWWDFSHGHYFKIIAMTLIVAALVVESLSKKQPTKS